MNLKHKKRQEIFKQFIYNEKLRFNEIEKATKIRSNELAYFLNKLVEENILLKQGSYYKLSKNAEKLIPLFGAEISPLPVILVACIKENKILLWKRKKRPYKNLWSLIGGRILLNETLQQASLRVLKEKTFIDSKFISINACINEKVEENGEIKHAIILFLTKVQPLTGIKEKPAVKWFNLSKLKQKSIIPSDYWLIKNKLNSKVSIPEETLKEKNGRLSIEFL